MDRQRQVQVKGEVREFGLSAAHLDHGDVVVSGVFRIARMLVVGRAREVHMSVATVTVKQRNVQIDALHTADVAIGVHMHVQAAELYGQKAHACDDGH